MYEYCVFKTKIFLFPKPFQYFSKQQNAIAKITQELPPGVI